jgi:hypothetical protein
MGILNDLGKLMGGEKKEESNWDGIHNALKKYLVRSGKKGIDYVTFDQLADYFYSLSSLTFEEMKEAIASYGFITDYNGSGSALSLYDDLMKYVGISENT